MNPAIVKQIFALRRKTLIALAGFVVLTGLLHLYERYFQEPKLERLRTEWQSMRELEGRGVSRQNKETLYKNGLADLATFNGRVYPKSQFARFIGELYELAGRNHLELSSISYKPTLNKELQLLEYQLSMSLTGSYPDLKRIVYDLGTSGNIMVINAMSLSAKSNNADAAMELKLQVTSYFRVEG